MAKAYVAGTSQKIDNAESYFAMVETSEAKRRLRDRPYIVKRPVIDSPVLKARVDHARWIVDCPNCGGAEYTWADGLFFCSLCENEHYQGQLLKVIMPSPRKVRQIETLLGMRHIVNRHWNPKETIKQLITENERHGIPAILLPGGDA